MSSQLDLWQPATSALTFPADRIDVWRVQADSADVGHLQGILARDEISRASRLQFERGRIRYIRGRSALRILLGRYLQVPPETICFQYENNGKPEIALPREGRELRFNSSDSGGLVLIAVGSGSGIGVDIEKIRPMRDLMNIAKRFFSTREVQAILGVTEEKRNEAFFACWTRKEAFLKATGVGLSYPLSQFSVSVEPDREAELCEIDGEEAAARRWFLTDVFPGEGFRGALAREGERCRIALWKFEPES